MTATTGLRPAPGTFDAQSHTPERRIEREAADLAARLAKITDHAAALGAAEGAEAIAADVVAELVRRHERATQAYWAAESRCMSWFIVGPANFPTERNRKRQRSAERRADEVNKHLAAALRRLDRLAYPHGMPGDAIRGNDPDALAKLQARLAEAVALLEAYKAANAAMRKGDWAGVAAAVGQERADREQAFVARWGYGGFNLPNRRAEIRRFEDRIAALQRKQERGLVESEVGGVRLVENPDADRVQLMFPGKPDDATRAILKSHGFRWAPSEGAWQRHLNNAGRYAAQCVLQQLQKAA